MSFMILKTFRGDSLSVAPLSHRTELRSKKVVSLSVLKCRSINCFLNWMTYSDSIKPVQNLISRKWNLGFFHSVLFFPPAPKLLSIQKATHRREKRKLHCSKAIHMTRLVLCVQYVYMHCMLMWPRAGAQCPGFWSFVEHITLHGSWTQVERAYGGGQLTEWN